MIDVNTDPNRCILPINETLVNKNTYIASQLFSTSRRSDIIAFAINRKSGWTWLFAHPNDILGRIFNITSGTKLNELLSTEFRCNGKITILGTSQELQTYLRTYGIDEHFQQLLEVPWSYL